MIPDSLRGQLENLLDNSIKQANPVSGGSINEAAKITDTEGRDFFLKWNTSAPDDMFPKEQKGLDLLKSAQSGLHCPKVINTGKAGKHTHFILMTYIPQGKEKADSSRIFGEQLAALHKVTGKEYGLDYDNYIGRLPQSNKKHSDWTDFFVTERLEPQLQMALDGGKLSSGISENFERLYKHLPRLLPDEPASLLHGDLWGGNYCYNSEGNPAIYDPAVYYGHREIEIAFTHLFGGFSPDFYRAYQQSFPLQPDFDKRKNIYNLYPLLVHANMFGASYALQVKSIISRF
jgi:fructosamine-3-kinase